MLNLKPKQLAELKKILATHASGYTVLAYGSRASDKSHEGSDLDLVIVNSRDKKKPFLGLSELRDALTESNLPFLVDVLDWANIPVSFQTEIECRHVVVQNQRRR